MRHSTVPAGRRRPSLRAAAPLLIGLTMFPFGAIAAEHDTMAAPAPAFAPPPPPPPPAGGFYLGVFGGANIAHDSEIDETASYFAFIPDGQAEFKDDTVVGAAVGYATGGAWRVDLEFSNRKNDFDRIHWDRVGKSGAFATTGDITAQAVLVNSVWDIRTGSRLRPMFGFGIGLAKVSLNNVRDANGLLFDETDTSFAAQFIGGVKVGITDSLGASIEYRYFVTSITADVDAGQPAIGGERMTLYYTTSSFIFGLRVQF